MELVYTEDGFLRRPLLPLYDSEVKGNWLVAKVLFVVYIGLLLLFNWYIGRSFLLLLEEKSFNAILNLLVLFVEFLTGNYFVFLVWDFSKLFVPIPRAPGYLGVQLTDRAGDEGNRIHYKEVEDQLPFVSVLIPLYQEHFPVVRKTILGALSLHYPKHKYDVNVIDDAPKDDQIKKFTQRLGVNYFSRNSRKGFKAGGINYALPRLKGDLVLFLDADHIPEPRVILNCLNGWREGSIGVQARIDFVNMVNFLTIMGAFLHLQFYSLLQRARRATGSAIFAGGTALLDRKLILQEGGIDELTIAEDTDTSILWISRNYRIEYIDHVGSWALVPWDPLSLVRQVWRWMTGVTRSFKARIVTLLRSKAPIYVKTDLFFAGIVPTLGVVAWVSGFTFIILAIYDIPLIRYSPELVFGSGSIPFISFIVSLLGSIPTIVGISALLMDDETLIYVRRGFFKRITYTVLFYFVSMAGQPLMLGAVIKGWLGSKVSFNRTPKKKKADEPEIPRLKKRYFLISFAIFLGGLLFLLTLITKGLSSPIAIPLFIGFYSSSLPFFIVLLWYWKLERYMDQVRDISADLVIEEKLELEPRVKNLQSTTSASSGE